MKMAGVLLSLARLLFLAALAVEQLSASSAPLLGYSYACGAPQQFTSNGISWTSDASVAPAGGNTLTVNSTNFRFFSPFNRSNPQPNPVCYDKINLPSSDGPILLRVTFQYQNYDGLSTPPKFEMWVGTTKVVTVDLSQRDPWTQEVIYSKPEQEEQRIFCLVAVAGAPVVSYIELRPLPASSYQAANDTAMLAQVYRLDCGGGETRIRYPNDLYDRIWGVDQSASSNTQPFSSNSSINSSQVSENPPLVVLQTSRVLSNGSSLSYSLEVEVGGEYHVKLYFANLMGPKNATTFNVLITGNEADNLRLSGLTLLEQDYFVVSSPSTISIQLQAVVNQPEINALEVFQVIPIGNVSSDGDALNSISSYYSLNQLGWVGDPCLPTPWKGVNCTNSVVTSLDLSNQDLVTFSDLFKQLTGLTYLNLSHNRLNDLIPDLTGLNHLQVLDLRDNDLYGTLNQLSVLGATLTNLYVGNNPRLSGRIPPSLNHSGLFVDTQGTCIGGNATCLPAAPPTDGIPLAPESSRKKSSSDTGPIVGGVVAAIAILLFAVGLLYLCWYRRRAPESTEKGHSGGYKLDDDLRNWTAARIFTYRELGVATINFKESLGRGSFGTVYFGKLGNGQQVAVKMRSDESQLGAEAFKNEVYLLSRVHHPNLVSLLGYCQEGEHQLLVYEYLEQGTLSDHLYGRKKGATGRLSWVDRLQIAVGSAAGIAYLHNECDPKIIHRDVKSNNILLDKSMMAKVSDFGLSKLVMVHATHVTTLVKGTAGYLDPEYYTTQQLTEKSDVYSFGVVLLEIVTGREPLNGDLGAHECNMLVWAKPYLVAGTYAAIVEKSIKNTYNPKTLSKVCDLALRCIEKRAHDRPSMLQVLRELEDTLALEVQSLDLTLNFKSADTGTILHGYLDRTN